MLWRIDIDCLGTITVLSQVRHSYPKKPTLLTEYSEWRAWTATLCTAAVAAGFAVTEAILILTLRVWHPFRYPSHDIELNSYQGSLCSWCGMANDADGYNRFGDARGRPDPTILRIGEAQRQSHWH